MAEAEDRSAQALGAAALLLRFFQSAVGAKVVMALTGAALWGFVLVHMAGNLQIFDPSGKALTEYGVFLREVLHGAGIWIARGGLVLAFGVHIAFGVRLAALNRAARPIAYAKKRRLRSIPTAFSMLPTGALIFAFLLFHLGHFTWGVVDAGNFHAGPDGHDVDRMVKAAFAQPLMAALYAVGQALVLMHLSHGTASVWQSLGLHHRSWSPAIARLGIATAVVIFLGNLAIVGAVLLGFVK